MDSTFEMACLKFRVAEIEELFKIKEKWIREFEEKNRNMENREKASMHNLTKTAFLSNTLQLARTHKHTHVFI